MIDETAEIKRKFANFKTWIEMMNKVMELSSILDK
jgi:hypothetical protein